MTWLERGASLSGREEMLSKVAWETGALNLAGEVIAAIPGHSPRGWGLEEKANLDTLCVLSILISESPDRCDYPYCSRINWDSEKSQT
jgi:hypothetical protein